MLRTDQLERFYMRLYKELADDERYWTKETILGLVQQMIDLSRTFDKREEERKKVYAEADQAINSLKVTAARLKGNKDDTNS